MSSRQVITVIYKSLPQYRVPFFNALRPYLDKWNIELRLIYGQPDPEELKKNDQGKIEWAFFIRNKIIKIGSRYLFWQPCFHLLKGSHLIILEQASKLIINYILILRQLFGGPHVAFWGHGKTLSEKKTNFLGEFLKRELSKRVWWWFAYNRLSADTVKKIGFPEERITIVQNTIETASLIKKRDTISTSDIQKLKASLNIDSENIGLFVGGLYKDKRLPFLLEAAMTIKELLPDFHLLVLGSGPEKRYIQEFAFKYSWIHYIGPVFGVDRVPYFMISKVLLLPGGVGLAIIDSFCLGVPLITTNRQTHGPEIEYLENSENGYILDRSTSAKEYGSEVAMLLEDERRLAKYRAGCFKSAKRYSLDEMVRRFTEGLKSALNLKG